MNRARIEQLVPKVAPEAFNHHYYVSPIDVLVGIGMLDLKDVENWRNRKVPYLEKVANGNLSQLSYAMRCFRKWAINSNLKPSIRPYLTKTGGGGGKPLRFSKYGSPRIETSYQTHYIFPELAEKKKQQLEREKLSKNNV